MLFDFLGILIFLTVVVKFVVYGIKEKSRIRRETKISRANAKIRFFTYALWHLRINNNLSYHKYNMLVDKLAIELTK